MSWKEGHHFTQDLTVKEEDIRTEQDLAYTE